MTSEELSESSDPVDLLNQVNLYRELRRDVRRGSTGTLIFGAIMLAIWYGVFGTRNDYGVFSLVYLTLGCLEVAVGLLNRLNPSPEGVFFDGLLLLLFGTATLARQLFIWQGMIRGFLSPISLIFGGYWLWQGYHHLQAYRHLRKIFPLRPQAKHLRWFEELLAEIRQAEPENDPTVLHLKTSPPIKVKLLGKIVFLLLPESEEIMILHDFEFSMTPLPYEESTQQPLASVWISEIGNLECPLDPINWGNYTKWAEKTGVATP
jgi:hypothetical protein